MTDIARDFDPEDSYDRTDPVPARIDILRRVVAAIRDEQTADPARAERRRRAALELIERLEDEIADAAAEWAADLGELRDRLALL